MSEMIGKLNLEPLNIRRTHKRLTISHKAINGHLALTFGHLHPVLRRTRHLNSRVADNSRAYNTIKYHPCHSLGSQALCGGA